MPHPTHPGSENHPAKQPLNPTERREGQLAEQWHQMLDPAVPPIPIGLRPRTPAA